MRDATGATSGSTQERGGGVGGAGRSAEAENLAFSTGGMMRFSATGRIAPPGDATSSGSWQEQGAQECGTAGALLFGRDVAGSSSMQWPGLSVTNVKASRPAASAASARLTGVRRISVAKRAIVD